jgi:hypothetical protein
LLNLMIVLKFALPQTGQKYQDSLAITLGPGLGLLPQMHSTFAKMRPPSLSSLTSAHMSRLK